MIIVMRNLMAGVFEHIDIVSVIDVDLRIKYTERVLRGPALQKYL